MISGIILLILLGIFLFFNQPQFGRLPSGNRLNKIRCSPNFKEGEFKNTSDTPALTVGVGYLTVLKEFFFQKNKNSTPSAILKSRVIDLKAISKDEDVIVWFGHSSYFMQLDGKKILVDPVFSGNASPVRFTTKSFEGSDVYTVDDLPEIDYLFISHDHYDHLDYKTIIELRDQVKRVITGLGTGEHFERWGYRADIITEGDWFDEIMLDEGFKTVFTPSRHFSGRGLKRNQALWTSFVLKTPNHSLYMGGDSGYDSHFTKIGMQYGPFDIAILECGQYNKNWKYIHMQPEEVVQAAVDLNAKRLMPVHWAKFNLSTHAWNEPIIRVSQESAKRDLLLITPVVGDAVHLKDEPAFEQWWND